MFMPVPNGVSKHVYQKNNNAIKSSPDINIIKQIDHPPKKPKKKFPPISGKLTFGIGNRIGQIDIFTDHPLNAWIYANHVTKR